MLEEIFEKFDDNDKIELNLPEPEELLPMPSRTQMSEEKGIKASYLLMIRDMEEFLSFINNKFNIFRINEPATELEKEDIINPDLQDQFGNNPTMVPEFFINASASILDLEFFKLNTRQVIYQELFSLQELRNILISCYQKSHDNSRDYLQLSSQYSMLLFFLKNANKVQPAPEFNPDLYDEDTPYFKQDSDLNEYCKNLSLFLSTEIFVSNTGELEGSSSPENLEVRVSSNIKTQKTQTPDNFEPERDYLDKVLGPLAISEGTELPVILSQDKDYLVRSFIALINDEVPELPKNEISVRNIKQFYLVIVQIRDKYSIRRKAVINLISGSVLSRHGGLLKKGTVSNYLSKCVKKQ